jgi:hypothetical protein
MKNPFTPLGKRGRAKRITESARQLVEAGKKSEAIATYQRAMAIDPTWPVPFFSLAQLHQHEGEWGAALEVALRATELAPRDGAGWWSLGIAATALGRWDVARTAWQNAGVNVPPGAGPVDFPCGKNQIRLAARGEAETVGADRIDPARARLDGIPRGSFCFGDVVLHDSEPAGYFRLRGEDVPVFHCLALLEPSPLATWCVDITVEEPKRKAEGTGPFAQLGIIARERGLAAVTRTATPGPGTLSTQRLAVAARTRGEVHDLLADWDAEGRGAVVGDIQMEFSHA